MNREEEAEEEDEEDEEFDVAVEDNVNKEEWWVPAKYPELKPKPIWEFCL